MNLKTSIEAHFKEIMNAKDRIRDMLYELDSVADEKMTAHMDNTRFYWKENACDLFIAKELRLSEAIIYESGVISKVIDEIENTTNNLWITEMINQGIGVLRNH